MRFVFSELRTCRSRLSPELCKTSHCHPIIYGIHRIILTRLSCRANSPQRRRLSERDPHAAVDDAALEWRPRVDGPPSVRRLKRTHERIEPRLPDSAQVLSVDE